MTSLEQLQAILNEQYVTEDGDEYKVVLKPGLTDQQIDALTKQLPSGHMPAEIAALLRFASGFEFYGLGGEITFDRYGYFAMDNIFPDSIELAGDGFGNFWIVDIDSKGNWGHVFFACHDPAVIVKHSENLAAFIGHIHEFGKYQRETNLDIIHEKTVMDIDDESTGGFIDIAQAKASGDAVLHDFASQLPGNFVIADLRNKPDRTGFAWGKFGPDIDKAVRYNDELLWGFES